MYLLTIGQACLMHLISCIPFNLHKIPIKQYLNISTVDTSGWIILCCGDCPVLCTMSCRIPSL